MTRIALHELQIIDSQIDKVNNHSESLEEKITLDEKMAELSRIGKIISDLSELIANEKKEQRKLEDLTTAYSEKIDREEKKLYAGTITNPKELKGIENEVRSLKGRRDIDETALLEVIEKVEEIDGHLTEHNKQLQVVRADTDLAQAKFEKASAEIAVQLKELGSQREEVEPLVAPDMLKLYDKLRNEKQGLAVTALDGSTCKGCHMELPSQEIERAMAGEHVWRCPHCRRILLRRT
ncbi:MAG TPA: hypothetical protein ENI11_02930 [Actinobacteria bacterium]|nr:hypothetical protein [Actinomycetota bacterium]